MTDRKYLKATATEVSAMLRTAGQGSILRLRQELKAKDSETGGWLVILGVLVGRSTNLEIWLDRFTNPRHRRLYYCFFSEEPKTISEIARRARPRMGVPTRIVDNDVNRSTDIPRLKVPVSGDKLSRPFHEFYRHEYERAFFGVYEQDTPKYGSEKWDELVERVVSFYETAILELPRANMASNSGTYPKYENRKIVASHIGRERSRYLATARKQLDNYRCGVCDFKFDEVYGKLGRHFAEAHHIVPLAGLKKRQITKIEDLATVCPNCHRMLHRMSGKRGDLTRLKKLLLDQRRKTEREANS